MMAFLYAWVVVITPVVQDLVQYDKVIAELKKVAGRDFCKMKAKAEELSRTTPLSFYDAAYCIINEYQKSMKEKGG